MEEEGQLVVRCIISAGSAHHFSSSSAKVRSLNPFFFVSMISVMWLLGLVIKKVQLCFAGVGYTIRKAYSNTTSSFRFISPEKLEGTASIKMVQHPNFRLSNELYNELIT